MNEVNGIHLGMLSRLELEIRSLSHEMPLYGHDPAKGVHSLEKKSDSVAA